MYFAEPFSKTASGFSECKIAQKFPTLLSVFRSTKHPIFIAMKNKVQFLNQKSSQNHKKSRKSKYITARFSVRVLWFSVRITLFIDFSYCYFNYFGGLPNKIASGFTSNMSIKYLK